MAERSTGARQSDEEILAALGGAPEAFAVFYRRHAAGLLRDLTARTGDARLAADACAEAFAAALEHAPRFDPARGSAAQWLSALAERELAHAERRGAVRDRARRRLGLPVLDAGGEDFERALEEELVAAARFVAKRRSQRPALRRPRRPRLPALAAGAAVLAIAAVAVVLLRGGGGDSAAGERSAAALPPTAELAPRPMQPLAVCGLPKTASLPGGGPLAEISLLTRRQQGDDALPFDPGRLPILSFDPRATRRAPDAGLLSSLYVIPSPEVATDGRCGGNDGPGVCLVVDERELACFTAAEVMRGRALARTSAVALVGLVPDGVDRVAVRGLGSSATADVVDNVYEARIDVTPGVPVELAFNPRDAGCRHDIAPELLAAVALLRDHPQPNPTLPQSARDAVREWGQGLDAIVEDGARYWGRDGSVDFWAVPVAPGGRPGCAPATRVCVVAAPAGARAVAQCVLGRQRRRERWLLGPVLPRNAVIFGFVPDGVTGVRVTRRGAAVDIPAHDNVFGGVLPFPYRASDRPRVELLHGEAVVEPLVGIVDAGGPVTDVVGRLRARGHKTLAAITPGIFDQRSVVYWWPGRATLQEAGDVAVAAGIEEVAAIVDTARVPRPVLDTRAPFVVVVGKR